MGDVVDIITLIDYFQQGITDDFSQIHQDIYGNDNISYDIILDSKVFYILQIPQDIITYNDQAVETEISSNSSSSSSKVNLITKELYWIIYVLAGFIISIIMYNLLKICKSSKT